MNKKKKDLVFVYPFKNQKEEAEKEKMDFVVSSYISDKGTKIERTQTTFTEGGYTRLVLKETVYLKNESDDKKLGEVLSLRPQEQVKREKYLVFNVTLDAKGVMFMTKKDNPKEVAKFNENEAKVILYFYELSKVVLKDAPKDLDYIYSTKGSLRIATVKINRKFAYAFKSIKNEKEKKLMSGDNRKDYSFNPYIRLNILK
jgi:hypothetical protein